MYKSVLPCDHSDKYKRISPDTMEKILNGELLKDRPYLIFDCRYSFEYNGITNILIQLMIISWTY